MSDTTTEVKAVLTAEDHATAVVKSFRRELERLTKTYKELTNIKMPNAFGPSALQPAREAVAGIRAETQAMQQRTALDARASRQRSTAAANEARQASALEAVRMNSIRRQVAFASRMGRQRAAEERAADQQRQRLEAAAERDAASSLRRQMAGDRWRFQLRDRMERQASQSQARDRRETAARARQAWGFGKDAYKDITRPPAVAALAGTAATGAAARRILGAESSIDGAEINARIYGGLSQDAARKLRDQWAAPLAEALGTGTDKLLSSYTDALKLGIPTAGAQAFSELATKTSEAWSVPFESVTDILGTVNSILTSKGEAFNFDKLKSVANAVQHLAAKQSTTPEKLMSYLQRGAGAAQVLGMSQEAGLAFGSASTSLGNQAGQSGRMFDYVASRLIEMPRLTRQHGEEGKQARDLVRALGYGSAADMDNQRRQNPDAFMPDFLSRFNKISDPKKQDQAIRFFTGREWLGEFGRMVKGIDTYKEAVKLARESKGLDAIGAVWDLHRTKLGFVFKQFRAGWLNILGEFGKVLSPMARQAGDSFLAWTAQLRAGGLSARFKAALEGFLNGLGFRDLPDMIRGIVGEPGNGSAGSISAWKSTFRELGAGIRDVVDSFKSIGNAFTGGSPEAIARWTGRIITLSAALLVLSPVLTVIGGLASGILALGTAAATVMTGLKVAGLAGGAGGAAATIGASVLATAGGLIGVAFLATIANKLNILTPPDMSKGWGRGILEFLDPGLARRFLGDDTESGRQPAWRNPPARVQRQSAAEDWHGKIQPASFGGIGDLERSIDRLGRNLTGTVARTQLAALSGPSAAAIGGFSGAGGGGDATSSSFVPPSLQVPGTYGKMPGGFGGSGSSGMPDPGSGAGTGPYKATLDYIAGAEGTAGKGDYNASLGYGKFLPGGVEQNLTGKTLNEILALGNHMRRQPGNPNSSALGRYQIVGKTLQGLMTKLGLSGSEKFDEAMQDRLGAELVRQRGADARGLGQEWASLRGAKGAHAAGLVGQIPRGSSTTPGPREAVAPGSAAAVTGKAAAAADVAKTFEGMHESGNRRQLEGFMGRNIQGAQNAWCAAFVNSSLKAVGMKGTGSGYANSFLGWGKGVANEDVVKGDVLVQHRNKGLNQGGGHVGIATGRSQMKDGKLQLEWIAGNSDDRVKTEWIDASKVAARRSTEAAATAAQVTASAQQTVEGIGRTAARAFERTDGLGGFTSSGWSKRMQAIQGNGVGDKAKALLGPTPDSAGGGALASVMDKGLSPFRPNSPMSEGKLDGLAAKGAGMSAGGIKMPFPSAKSAADSVKAGVMSKASDISGASAAGSIPRPDPRSGGAGGAGGGRQRGDGGPGFNITIHAGNQDPAQMAGHIQKHVTEAWNYRSHDVEPELT